MKILLLLASHIAVAAVGFALGIFALPILTAPPAPDDDMVNSLANTASYTGEFRRDLAGSDFLHWGEGTVSIGQQHITLSGSIAPGPDYKLYLTTQFVETEAAFEKIKTQAVRVGDVRTFDNFVVPVPADINPASYNTVVIWCESFGEFISAARYQ